MVLFLFIAISLILQVRQIAEEYQDTQEQIYKALLHEFADDLPKWGAKIDKDTLTISFLSPDILFKTGQSDLQDNYKEILSDFFPRYIKVIDRYKDSISEIRTRVIPAANGRWAWMLILLTLRTCGYHKTAPVLFYNLLMPYLKSVSIVHG